MCQVFLIHIKGFRKKLWLTALFSYSENTTSNIKNYGMDNPTKHLKGYKDATILYKKVRIDKHALWDNVAKLKYIKELTKIHDV